jgi:hypothetical protein
MLGLNFGHLSNFYGKRMVNFEITSANKYIRAAGYLGGFITGCLLIIFSAVMLSDIPLKADLYWLPSEEVSDIKYIEKDGMISKIRFYTNDEYCLSLTADRDGFPQLLYAALKGKDYSIGYHKESQLFSDGVKRYKKVYEVSVSNKIVLAHKRLALMQLAFLGAFGVFGFYIFFLMYRDYRPISSE